MKIIQKLSEYRALRNENIDASKPRKSGVMKEKRKQEIIILLTSYPARLGSAHKSIRTLLHQGILPDRVILWLATEQFPNGEGIPEEITELQKYGLEIGWYHDIRSYKKLIPALINHPDAVIVTVDDDWYYRRDMLRILLEEHQKWPNQVICHTVTRVRFGDEGRLVPAGDAELGTSSFFNKVLGSGGILYPPGALDDTVLDEKLFMDIAPTNDDIWFWAMAVKKGTKVRLAEKALGNALMTDSENQLQTSLAIMNCQGNTYANVTNQMLKEFSVVRENLERETYYA